ncbi:MAG: type III secretion system outer membrane ring subunit SctC [Candidatus Adiutrix sp.]|jgi:type III secretion protein C|nr:type III secretion system outer membrane ring subunit SctC [Candidatus Adiutrix sp.]
MRPLVAAFGLWLALVNLAAGLGAQPLPGRPFTRPYTHYSRQEPLRLVLADFARAEGYQAEISPAVDGLVNGRFQEVEPKTFLDGLGAAYGLRWYLSGATLHFYHDSEAGQVILQPRNLTAGQLYERLLAAGAISPQLPPRQPQGEGPLVAAGPPAYLAALQAAAAAVDQGKAQNTVMRVFKLKYASADDQTVNSQDRSVTIPGVASILRAMLTGQTQGPVGTSVTVNRPTVEKLKGTGLIAQGQEKADAAGPAGVEGAVNIMADPRVNAVVVQDRPERMPYYAQVIEDLDQPVNLVEIHAAIVDINTEFKRDLGVGWQGRGTADGWGNWGLGAEQDTAGGSYNPLPDAGQPDGAGLLLSTIYTHGDRFFLARIRALENNGEARMLGRPSVLTADNLEATLEDTYTYYIPVSGQEEVDLFKVESGTVLRVTPHIIDQPDRPPSVRLLVTVQDGMADPGSAAGGNLAMPPIKQTKINTQAVIEAGQSLLIGGYYFEELQNSESGVPVLMHVPVLGHLFKSSVKGTRRMERLVLITPRVVRLGETPAAPSRLDEPSFSRSPTQADYELREPVLRTGGGCRRK